jgi:PIN domain nuclease of toxin-antitoxin system
VKLLLDTHIALWAVTDDPRLSQRARQLILDGTNEVYFSAVSTWEIAIKRAIGGDIPCSAREAEEDFVASGYRPLHIEPRHTIQVEALPLHHRDPFDRLLIAQATMEMMMLLTADQAFEKYQSPFITMVN